MYRPIRVISAGLRGWLQHLNDFFSGILAILRCIHRDHRVVLFLRDKS